MRARVGTLRLQGKQVLLMSQRKADDPPPGPLGGSSRIWAGDGVAPRSTAARPQSWEGPRNWLNRAPPSTGRHAAITNSLHSWNSYKSWADRVKSTWDKDK